MGDTGKLQKEFCVWTQFVQSESVLVCTVFLRTCVPELRCWKVGLACGQNPSLVEIWNLEEHVNEFLPSGRLTTQQLSGGRSIGR